MFSITRKKLLLAFLLLSNTHIFALETYTYTTKTPQLVMFPDVYNPETGLTKSRLLQIASDIEQRGSFQDKQLFARIAVSEMSTAYEHEAILIQETLRQANKKNKDKRKYSAWGKGTLAYAEQMHQLDIQIEQAARIDIITEDQTEVLLMIDNTPVVVSSPVINQQARFEQQIMQRACEYFACNESVLASIQKPTSKLIQVKAAWKLEANQYVFYTFSGIHFPFKNQEQRNKKEKFALQLARDLNLLSKELDRLNSQNLPIEWHKLAIKQVNEQGVCEVIFNSFGDAVYMELVVLQKTIKTHLLIPWLKKRLFNTQVRLNIEDIDDLFAQSMK